MDEKQMAVPAAGRPRPRRALRIILLGLLALGLLVGGAIAAFLAVFPRVGPAPAGFRAATTPDALARGRYLVDHVAVCVDCHSRRDWTRFSGPVVPGTEGMGGERFAENIDLPGEVFAPNITPAGLASWSDGEVLRAVAMGVSRDGRALFPLMPYLDYARASEEDLAAIIGAVRTLPPVPNEVPRSRLHFPLNIIVRLMPAERSPVSAPPQADSASYGGYLATLAACADCHTPRKKGKPLEGMEYAGGPVFHFPSGDVRALNVTPDPETGIGAWSRKDFIARFRAFEPTGSTPERLVPGGFNSPMPWIRYAGMTESDLGALYQFLRSLPPVRNRVERFVPKG